MPLDDRERAVFERIVADQSELRGVSSSDAIVGDVLESALPKDCDARRHALAVLSGERTVLGDMAVVLREDPALHGGPGSLGVFRLAERVVREKDMTTALDNAHPKTPHAAECLGSMADYLGGVSGTSRLARHGRALVAELDPARFSRGPASALIRFAEEWTAECGEHGVAATLVADVLEVLDDTEARWRADGGGVALADTARQRFEWIALLGERSMPCATGEGGPLVTSPSGCRVIVEWDEGSLRAAGADESDVEDWVGGVFRRLGVPSLGPGEWGWRDGECRVGDDRHLALVVAAHMLVSGELSPALSRVLTSEGAGWEDLLAYHREQARRVRGGR